MQRSMAVVALCAMLATACTGGTSDPSPTSSPTRAPASGTPSGSPPPGRVAVVMAPGPSQPSEVEVRRAVAGRLDGAELRTVVADDVSFVSDMTAFFATEGYDLVCAVGEGAADAVREVAPSSPSTRFCAAPATAEGMADNVLPIDVRVEELGYLAGVSLGTDDPSGGTVLLTSSATWAPQRVRIGLHAGLATAGVGSPSVTTVGPIAPDREDLPDRLSDLLGRGITGVLSMGEEADAAVLGVLEDMPLPDPTPTSTPTEASEPTEAATPPPERFAGLVAGPGVRPTEDPSDQATPPSEPPALLLAIARLRLQEAVAVALARHAESAWDTAPVSLGLQDNAIEFRLGEGERAGAVRAAVDDAESAIRNDQLDVPAE